MDADEVQENLKTNEDVTIFIINGAYIKINKGNYLPTNFDELDKTCNLILCRDLQKNNFIIQLWQILYLTNRKISRKITKR